MKQVIVLIAMIVVGLALFTGILTLKDKVDVKGVGNTVETTINHAITPSGMGS